MIHGQLKLVILEAGKTQSFISKVWFAKMYLMLQNSEILIFFMDKKKSTCKRWNELLLHAWAIGFQFTLLQQKQIHLCGSILNLSLSPGSDALPHGPFSMKQFFCGSAPFSGEPYFIIFTTLTAVTQHLHYQKLHTLEVKFSLGRKGLYSTLQVFYAHLCLEFLSLHL